VRKGMTDKRHAIYRGVRSGATLLRATAVVPPLSRIARKKIESYNFYVFVPDRQLPKSVTANAVMRATTVLRRVALTRSQIRLGSFMRRAGLKSDGIAELMLESFKTHTGIRVLKESNYGKSHSSNSDNRRFKVVF